MNSLRIRCQLYLYNIIALSGRIQTGSYTNRDNVKVYTTDVVVEEWEFAESKAAAGQQATPDDGFMHIDDDMDEQLPFT
jgi:single-strand DNA-binding protein